MNSRFVCDSCSSVHVMEVFSTIWRPSLFRRGLDPVSPHGRSELVSVSFVIVPKDLGWVLVSFEIVFKR